MATSNERGGRRPRSGARPGRDTHGHLPQPPPPRPYYLPAATCDIQQLPSAIQTALTLSARGRRNDSIAQELGRDPKTIANWLRRYPDQLQAAIRAVAGLSPREAFAPHLPATMLAFADTLALEDPAHAAVRLQAATRVAEYVYDKPVTRTEFSGLVTPSINIFDSTLNFGSTPTPASIVIEQTDTD